ncbi:MAG: NADH-quinone oxidoreductase subunit M [Oligoflexia bacterium]|nr:NADH-quinone oxidoreductase subunit M [Oligoflexia bacterium]
MGLLSWLILLPFLTALAIVFTPGTRKSLIKWIALAGTGTHLLLTAFTTWRYWTLAAPDMAEMRTARVMKLYLVERLPWFDSLGIQYFLGIDGISMAMVILTSIIIFTGVLASWKVEERAKEFFALLLLLVTGVFGVFLSFDLFLFLMFYEVAVLPMYLLIGVWGTGPKEYSAMKLTLMLLLGSALLIVGFLGLYSVSGLQTFDLTRLAEVSFPAGFQKWAFPAIFIGFGVLGALYPFHTWSPDGHASAPTAVSMLHAGVLMKLGGYGALRVAVYLLPEGAKDWGLFFMALTTINILYGAFGAITQKDLKYFTAYSSVSHCGFVLFGVAALNLMGMKGAVLQMFSHGVMTGLFFALIGMVYGRTHTRMIPEMGGLGKVMPWLAVCFYVGGLASLGLPGLSGFVAESHVFLGGFFGNPWGSMVAMRTLTVVATLSVVVTAVYVLRGLGRVFMGPVTDPHFHELKDATLTERISTGVLVATLAAVGLMPWLLIDLIEASIMPIVNRLHS